MERTETGLPEKLLIEIRNYRKRLLKFSEFRNQLI